MIRRRWEPNWGSDDRSTEERVAVEPRTAAIRPKSSERMGVIRELTSPLVAAAASACLPALSVEARKTKMVLEFGGPHRWLPIAF